MSGARPGFRLALLAGMLAIAALAVPIGDVAEDVHSAGFAAVAAVWWLYFDRQADVVAPGRSAAMVVYSHAHLPLLIGLAATSGGLRLLIERAGEEHLGVGPGAALLGGVALFLGSLVVTRTVTVDGPHRLGMTLKLGTATIALGLIGAAAVLPAVAMAGALAILLAALVVAERELVAKPLRGRPIGHARVPGTVTEV